MLALLNRFSVAKALHLTGDRVKNPNAETLEKDPMVCYAQSVKEGYQATSDAMKKLKTDAYNRAHKVWVAGMLRIYAATRVKQSIRMQTLHCA